MEQRFRPTVDVVFKAIFGDEENKYNILIPFLQDVLQCTITDLTLMDPIFKIEDIDDKAPILDIKVQTEQGDLVNVEVQVARQNEFAKRSLYYWAKMYQAQLIKGSGYEKLEKAIAINILDFSLFDTSVAPGKYHTKFEVREVELGFRLTDDLEMHFLELPKFLEDKGSNLDDWVLFFRHGHELQEEVYQDMIQPVREAISRLDRLGKNDHFKAVYEARQKEASDREAEAQFVVKENNMSLIRNFLSSQQINPDCYAKKLSTMKATDTQEFLLGLFGKPKQEIIQKLEEL